MTPPNGTEKPEIEAAGQGAVALVRTLRYLFIGLRILIVLIFAWMLLQGIFIVREHEEAMLFHFGRLVTRGPGDDGILTSGRLYWAWPSPIDRVQRIPARRPVLVESKQFWPKMDPNKIAGADAPAPGGEGLRPGEDGYLLTADANIMHMLWSATFTIRDARRYYLDFFEGKVTRTAHDGKVSEADERTAETLVRYCLESAVLQEVSGWSVEDVLLLARPLRADGEPEAAPAARGDGARESLRDAVQRRVQAMVAEVELGIEIQYVNVTSPSPPLTAEAAFREVTDAAQEYQKAIDEAQAYRRKVETEAEGQAAQIIGEAHAYASRIVSSVEADAAYFKKVQAEYVKNPKSMLLALYSDTLRDVVNQAGSRYVVHSRPDGRQEIRLMLGPEPEKPRDESEQAAGHP